MYKSLLLFVSCLIAFNAVAQQTKSSLSGIVSTENGTKINDVTVVVTHIPTGTIYGSATNTSGSYYINDIKPGGPYQIEFSSFGYKKELLTAIFLKLDEPLRLNITLEDLSNPLPEVKIVSRKNKLPGTEQSGPITNISHQTEDHG